MQGAGCRMQGVGCRVLAGGRQRRLDRLRERFSGLEIQQFAVLFLALFIYCFCGV